MKATLIALALAAGLPACTAERVYGTGQAWQRNECGRIPDKAEYDRCMREADRSYDAYRREKP